MLVQSAPVRLSLVVLAATTCLGCSSSDAQPDDGGMDSGRDAVAPPETSPPGDRYIGPIDPEALQLEVFPERMQSYVGANALLLGDLRNTAGLSLDLAVNVKPEMPVKIFPIDEADRTLFEVLVAPRAEQLEGEISVELAIAGHGVLRAGTMVIEVVTDTAPPEPPAGLLDRFVAALEQDHGDLGITSATEWQSLGGLLRAPDDGVQGWLYISSTWELGLSWSGEAPPDDWAEIYLRRRRDFTPSFAARLPSRSGDDAIAEQTPPAEPLR